MPEHYCVLRYNFLQFFHASLSYFFIYIPTFYFLLIFFFLVSSVVYFTYPSYYFEWVWMLCSQLKGWFLFFSFRLFLFLFFFFLLPLVVRGCLTWYKENWLVGRLFELCSHHHSTAYRWAWLFKLKLCMYAAHICQSFNSASFLLVNHLPWHWL